MYYTSMAEASPARMRRTVRDRIAHAVLAYGEPWLPESGGKLSRAELQKASGIGRASYYDNIDALVQAKVLYEPPGRGPRFSGRLGFVLAASVATETLRVALYDANGQPLLKQEAIPEPGRLNQGPEMVINQIADLVRAVLGDALGRDQLAIATESQRALPLHGIAVAWPLALDRGKRPRGIAELLLDGEEWARTSLSDRVADELRLDSSRSHALNNANACALAAAFNRSRDPSLLLREEGQVTIAVRVGGGLGAGTAIIGKHVSGRSAFMQTSIIEGRNGVSGEIGRLPVSPDLIERMNRERTGDYERLGLAALEGRAGCSCPSEGHLHAFCSAQALETRVAASPGLARFAPRLSPQSPRDRRGNMAGLVADLETTEAGRVVLEDMGRILGYALESPIRMMNPLSIVITGSCATQSLMRGISDASSAIFDSGSATEPEGNINPDRPDPFDPRVTRQNDPYIAARGAAMRIMRAELYEHFDALGHMQPADWVAEKVPLFTEADLARSGAPHSLSPRWGQR